MKKSKIYTLVMLACMTFGFALTAKAQFSSSEEVYCYQYEKTVRKDGVIGKDSHNEGKIICIYFHDEKATYLYLDPEEKNTLGLRLAEDGNFLKDLLKQRFYLFVNGQWALSKPLSPDSRYCYKTPPYGNKYYQPLSTSSYYTYKSVQCRSGREEWSNPDNFLRNLMSISIDKSELIVWGEKYGGGRSYYKRVDPNSFKTNLDFLD